MRRRPQRVRLESSGALMSPPPALSRSGVRLIALVLVVMNFLADLMYGLLDPRVTHGEH